MPAPLLHPDDTADTHSSSTSTGIIRIRLFAGLREQAGWAVKDWPHAPEATADETTGSPRLTPRSLWTTLQLPGGLETVRVAINQHFASADTPLCSGDELAFLPPISGG